MLFAVRSRSRPSGKLALDGAKLQTAIDTNFNDIAGLFANQGKSSSSLVSYVSATDKTQPGSYAFSVSQVASRGYRNGDTTAALADNGSGTFTAPFAVVPDNDTFSVKLDGVQAGTITLAQANYATAAALTAEIQSKINGDSALKAAGGERGRFRSTVPTTVCAYSPTDMVPLPASK